MYQVDADLTLGRKWIMWNQNRSRTPVKVFHFAHHAGRPQWNAHTLFHFSFDGPNLRGRWWPSLCTVLVDHLVNNRKKSINCKFFIGTQEYPWRFHSVQKPSATFYCTILFNNACKDASQLVQTRMTCEWEKNHCSQSHAMTATQSETNGMKSNWRRRMSYQNANAFDRTSAKETMDDGKIIIW